MVKIEENSVYDNDNVTNKLFGRMRNASVRKVFFQNVVTQHLEAKKKNENLLQILE